MTAYANFIYLGSDEENDRHPVMIMNTSGSGSITNFGHDTVSTGLGSITDSGRDTVHCLHRASGQ